MATAVASLARDGERREHQRSDQNACEGERERRKFGDDLFGDGECGAPDRHRGDEEQNGAMQGRHVGFFFEFCGSANGAAMLQ